MMCSLANLDSGKLEEIKKLEGALNKTILAYSCGQANPANLKNEELKKIEEAEKKLGLSLVAVE